MHDGRALGQRSGAPGTIGRGSTCTCRTIAPRLGSAGADRAHER